MKVIVGYLGHIKSVLGVEHTEEIKLKNGDSVGDLLNLLSEKHGEALQKSYL